MKLKTKTTEVAELEDKDIKILRHILNYTIHRLRNHRKIIPFLDILEVERLRRELKIIK